jgi:predicted amidohydrolase
VVQLDTVPQAREEGLWIPAEPRLQKVLAPDMTNRKYSVGQLFGRIGQSPVYQDVTKINAESVEKRLREVLDYLVASHVNVVVLPEYAVPVDCLSVLIEYSDRCVIVGGLGRIRNDETASVVCENADDRMAAADVQGRNASVLVVRGRVLINTKQYLAAGEEVEEGEGPWSEILEVGRRNILVGVAVCLDFLRAEEHARSRGADVVCIPARSKKVEPFRPDESRDHVRMLANAAEYGGSTIMVPGLHRGTFRDRLGVQPIGPGHEGIVIVDFDRRPNRPAGLRTPKNRLVARAEIIERGSRRHELFASVEQLNGRAGDATVLGRLAEQIDETTGAGAPGPLAESVEAYLQFLRQNDDDTHAAALARTHLVVEPGNRPSAIRERQARHVWTQLDWRQNTHGTPIGAALDIYATDLTEAAAPSTRDARFDAEIYMEKVIRAIRPDRPLPGLAERYALGRDLTGEAVVERVKEVVELWKRQQKSPVTSIGDAVGRLLTDHAGLAVEGDMESASWWRRKLASGSAPGTRRPDPPVLQRPTSGIPFPAATVKIVVAPDTDPEPVAKPKLAEPTDELPPPDPLLEFADLEAISARALPPPGKPQMKRTSSGVALKWSAPPVEPGSVRYLVRRAGLETPHETEDTSWLDGSPPVGIPLQYVVTALSMIDGARSQAAGDPIIYAPPVTDCAIQVTRTGGVEGSWRPPPEAAAVEVRRTVGEPSADTSKGVLIPVDGNTFSDPDPPAGQVLYDLVPVYPRVGGTQYRGVPAEIAVEIIATPQPPNVTSVEVTDDSRIILECDELPTDVRLVLVRVLAEPPGKPGDILLAGELPEFGAGVELTRSDRRGCATEPQLTGVAVYVPFAAAGVRMVRGEPMRVAVIPPVRHLEAVRNDNVATVSWGWPLGIQLARVTFGEGELRTQEITRFDYKRRGGIEYREPEEAGVVVVGALRVGAEILLGVPASTTIPARPVIVTYSVERVGLARLGWASRRTVTVRSNQPCRDVRIEIYLHSPKSGTERDVRLKEIHAPFIGPHSPYRVTVVLDGVHLHRPYYVSVRAHSPSAELVVDVSGSTGREVA